MANSRETFAPSSCENTNPLPIPIAASVNLEISKSSSPESSVPPSVDNPLTASMKLEKSMCSSPQISALHGWENTGPRPSPSEESEETDISPKGCRPPGWECFVPETFPPPPIPVSQSIEKEKGSSAEMSQPPGWENYGSQPISAPLPGMGQMVCGSCRQLLSYPQGTMRVKCPCCQIINFVLEEHQVGTVKCAKCWVWLMYPYGAPSVRCSACQFVTNIGANNARPPLSVQQRRSSVSQSPVH